MTYSRHKSWWAISLAVGCSVLTASAARAQDQPAPPPPPAPATEAPPMVGQRLLPSPMPSPPPMLVEAERIYGVPVNRYFYNITANELRALEVAGYDDDEIGEILYMAQYLGQPVTTISRWRDLSYGNVHVMAVDLGLNPVRVQEAGDRLAPYVRAMLDEGREKRRMTRRMREMEREARRNGIPVRETRIIEQREVVAGERQMLPPPSAGAMTMSEMEMMHRDRIYGVPADYYFQRVSMTDLRSLDTAGYSDEEIGQILYMSYHLGQPVATVARWRDVTYGGDLNRMAVSTGLNATRIQEAGNRLAPHVRMMMDRSGEMRMR